MWNHNNPAYHENAKNKGLLYDIIFKELEEKFEIDVIKKKWKDISKRFKEEHSKATVKPSGSGTDEIYKPSFELYKQLQFLTKIQETDETMDTVEYADSNPKPPKRSKQQLRDDRENKKLELFSEAVKALKETADSPKRKANVGADENPEAVAFGTYVGITLSKLNRQRFRQAKKCISDILYSIEEGEDLSFSSVPNNVTSFDGLSRSSASSYDTFNSARYSQYPQNYTY